MTWWVIDSAADNLIRSESHRILWYHIALKMFTLLKSNPDVITLKCVRGSPAAVCEGKVTNCYVQSDRVLRVGSLGYRGRQSFDLTPSGGSGCGNRSCDLLRRSSESKLITSEDPEAAYVIWRQVFTVITPFCKKYRVSHFCKVFLSWKGQGECKRGFALGVCPEDVLSPKRAALNHVDPTKNI